MPTLKNVKPEAIALASRIMAARRRVWAPLRGDALVGFKLAALAHRYGVDGRWLAATAVVHPVSVIGQAGWLVFVGEGWAKPRPPPGPLTARQKRRRREAAAAKLKAKESDGAA